MTQISSATSTDSTVTRTACGTSVFKQGFYYALLLVIVRIIQLAAIGWLTGGSEFADDISFQLIYAADPLQLLLGRSSTYQVFPPLFPMVLWTIHTPLSLILAPFYSMRMTMCVLELLAWPLVWWIVISTVRNRSRHLLALTFILAPMCWVSSVIMCQDEVTSLIVFAAVTLALLKERLGLAVLLCGIGVVLAKIYFLVPLVGLVGIMAGRTWKQWLGHVLLGLGPIAVVYGLQAVLADRADHTAAAFGGFSPPIHISINAWVLVERLVSITPEQAKHISAVIAMGASMLPLLAVRLRGVPTTPTEQIRVVVAMLLWVYLLFYHINPEYYIIVVPGILIVFRPVVASIIAIFLFSLPWAINFFYGVGVGMARGDEGRGPFVRIYRMFFSVDPVVLQTVSILLLAAATLLLALRLTWLQVQRPPRPDA